MPQPSWSHRASTALPRKGNSNIPVAPLGRGAHLAKLGTISLASPLSLHQTLVKILQTLCAKEDSGPTGAKMS